MAKMERTKYSFKDEDGQWDVYPECPYAGSQFERSRDIQCRGTGGYCSDREMRGCTFERMQYAEEHRQNFHEICRGCNRLFFVYDNDESPDRGQVFTCGTALIAKKTVFLSCAHFVPIGGVAV